MTPREAFRLQSRACDELGSPFLARLMRLAAERIDRETAVGRRLLDWAGDPSPFADALPLRFAGALHALVLGGRDEALAAAFPPGPAEDEALWAAINGACLRHEATILAQLDRPPQTNEVRRAAALIPALHLLAARFGLPIRLSELGASAGLNLHCDRFRLDAGGRTYGPADSLVTLHPDWTGPAPPPAALRIAERAGVDRSPFDLASAADRVRLLCYLWPDQFDRIARTEAAITLARKAGTMVARGDAIDWLAGRLAAPAEGETHVVFHTIAWQYFPAAAQARGEALLAEAGRRATEAAPLARFAFEADGNGPGAPLRLTIWPGGATQTIGRMDFHGRWIDWTGPVRLVA